MHLVNQAADVVADDYQLRLVDLGSGELAAHCVANHAFDHTERRLDIAAAVVVGQELFPVHREEVKQKRA